MSPTFTVLIPVYNAGRYLREAIDSVLAQTYQDWELIVVDDGSTDGVCEALATGLADARICFVRQANAGPSAACNVGIAMAKGEYIAFLDQDDLWHPDKLRSHLDAFKAYPQADLTFSWYTYIGADGQELRLHPTRWGGVLDFDQLLADNVIGPTSTVAIRREAIQKAGGCDTAFDMSYDVDLHLRVLCLKPANGVAIPKVLAKYRRHPHQMSRDWRALKTNWLDLLAKYEDLEPEIVHRVQKRAGTIMCHYFASVAYERRDFTGALGELMQGARRDPTGVLTSPRNWLAFVASLAGILLPAGLHRGLERLAGVQSIPMERRDG